MKTLLNVALFAATSFTSGFATASLAHTPLPEHALTARLALTPAQLEKAEIVMNSFEGHRNVSAEMFRSASGEHHNETARPVGIEKSKGRCHCANFFIDVIKGEGHQ